MPQINKPNEYFNTVLYTGTGAEQSISGVNFAPDWVWIKKRNGTTWHNLYDSIRGATKDIYSNATDAEGTNTNRLTSFDSNGFSVGNDGDVNANGDTYASWNWLAGGTASSNTDGSITSQVSANTTSGFSIVTYTGTAVSGATVGHGLGVAPSVVILKNRTGYDWQSYWSALGNNRSMVLNSNGTGNTGTGFWNDTNPSSSVVTLGNDGSHSGNCVMYCFAEKKGFSKFGSFTGNGSTDGTFVYTGFKPAFVMIKASSIAGESWQMLDSARDIDNPTEARLIANGSNAENTSDDHLDILSNGFKLRWDNPGFNQSGATYIYMCFASSPLVTSTGVPTTAR